MERYQNETTKREMLRINLCPENAADITSQQKKPQLVE